LPGVAFFPNHFSTKTTTTIQNKKIWNFFALHPHKYFYVNLFDQIFFSHFFGGVIIIDMFSFDPPWVDSRQQQLEEILFISIPVEMKNDFTSVCVMEDPEKAETHQKTKDGGKQ
jgi:hypothetical protein